MIHNAITFFKMMFLILAAIFVLFASSAVIFTMFQVLRDWFFDLFPKKPLPTATVSGVYWAPRVLKLHEPTGHPYWNEGMHKVQMPEGDFVPVHLYKADDFSSSNYRIFHDEIGVWAQFYNCGSGYGRSAAGCPVLIVPRSSYDRIEYVGVKKEMSQTLKDNLKEAGLDY